MEQARAALGLASYSIQKATLKAPFDGVVTNLMVNEGEFVGPQLAAYGMLTLVDVSEVKVKVNVTEKDLPLIQQQMGAEISTDAYPDASFAGKVTVIMPSADPLSKSFPVEISASNPEEMLKSGMFVRVRIHVQTVEDALSVTPKALVEMKDGYVVYVVDDQGRVHKTEVTIGLETDEGVQITGGEVKAGDTVVVEGNFGLKDGARVLVDE
jgi:RND family efflux transporter MFP subunit